MPKVIKSIFLKRIIIFLAFVVINFGGGNLVYAANMQPRSVKKVMKEQEKKEKQKKKEIEKDDKAAKKRAYDIQSPEVKQRMKQNKKDITAREKAKKKQNHSKTKKAAKKYR